MSGVFLVAAIWIVIARTDGSAILAAVKGFSGSTLVLVFAALLANAFAAAWRFRIIAADVGHSITFWQAMRAVSGGSIGGAIFFQIFGQLIARGTIMARSGVPFASVVVMTTCERFVAAIVSALLALGGAYFIFGQIFLDYNAGGADFVKTIIGLFVAAATGCAFGYGPIAAQAISPAITRHFLTRLPRMIGLSLLVQLSMMVAYVIAAHALEPDASIQNLIAASSIVMFAASIPISFAGWGVREMSAVIALGTIGVGSDKALVVALAIGVGSLLAMAAMALVSVSAWTRGVERVEISQLKAHSINWTRVVTWVLPLAAATLVLFQIHIPISSGTLLNVNLADPIALIGAMLFVVTAVRNKQLPIWRIPHVNIMVVSATLMFAVSLLIGAVSFGWTEWAWVNRFFGWFVLLGFAASGALIVMEAGERGLKVLLMTFAGAAMSIAAIDIALVALHNAGYRTILPVVVTQIAGFAQNRNAFAFQLLMALAATLVAAHGNLRRVIWMAILVAGLFFCGSRSAWIALPLVLLIALWMCAVNGRELMIGLGGASFLAALVILIEFDFGAQSIPQFLPTSEATRERWFSIERGFRMFLEYPIFGAGLGAFRQEMAALSVTANGIPLIIHSTAIWLLAEMGIVGFLIFACPAIYLLLTEARRRDPDIAGKLIVLCLVAFAVMSGPADMFYQRTFWLLIGAALMSVSGLRKSR